MDASLSIMTSSMVSGQKTGSSTGIYAQKKAQEIEGGNAVALVESATQSAPKSAGPEHLGSKFDAQA